MTNLRFMTDDTLLNETQKLAKQEHELLSQILHALREIERRRLFSKLKRNSLFDYATKELGYSEDQAYRRIQAMRLLKELPELEEKINSGTLNLSHLGMAQSLFKREEKWGSKIYSQQEKLEILEKLEGKSKREAEKITASLTLNPLNPLSTPDKIKPISDEHVEIKFIAKAELADKIEKLKALLAHKNPQIQLAELIDQLCDLGLEKWDKTNSAPARVTQRQSPAPMSKAQARREVWKAAKGKCENCNSQYALEIDHKFPKAHGGDDSLENLRLLCRSCNQRAAIQIFGIKKVERYIEL
jgi:hypothetical protein